VQSLDERFTSLFYPAALICVDEVERVGLGKEGARKSRLRRLITEPTFTYEKKGKDAVELPNRTNLILCSNSIDSLHIATGERRLLILHMEEKPNGYADFIPRSNRGATTAARRISPGISSTRSTSPASTRAPSRR
jgi:hypothetical protein